MSEEAKARFYALAWPQSPAVLRIARYLVRNHAEAEDIAQETMIKAYKAIGSFRDGTDMKAWLLTILRNTKVDHVRSAASSVATVSFGQLGTEPVDQSDDNRCDEDPVWDSPDRLLEQFSDENVIDALHQLPLEICWTLLLVDVEQMDHEDAAKVLEIPVGTVKSRAFRGRAMLRQTLLPLAKDLRMDGRAHRQEVGG